MKGEKNIYITGEINITSSRKLTLHEPCRFVLFMDNILGIHGKAITIPSNNDKASKTDTYNDRGRSFVAKGAEPKGVPQPLEAPRRS